MRDLPPEEVYKYACEDADVTLKLKNVLEEELKKQGVEHLFYEIEMPLVRVLANLESNGVRIDTEALKQTSEHFTVRLQEIEKEIYELAEETFNIASPKQVGEILFDKLKITDKAKKTKTGQYVTSEEVLESLRNKHEIIGKILEYRGLKKLLGTYIDALPLLINPRTGRIHTSLTRQSQLPDDSVPATRTCKTFLSATKTVRKSVKPSFRTMVASSSPPTIHR